MKHKHGANILGAIIEHLPYSVISVLGSLLIVIFLYSTIKEHSLIRFFHVLHPVHILLSAAATSAMFRIFKKNILMSFFVGLTGSILICSISDIVLPYVGGSIISGKFAHIHICVIEHPWLIIPFAIIGVIVGIFTAEYVSKSTFYAHSAHVLVSSTASFLFIVSFFTEMLAVKYLGWALIVVIISVVIPCVISDIVYPLLFIKNKRNPNPNDSKHCHN